MGSLDQQGFEILLNIVSTQEIHSVAESVSSSSISRSRAGMRHALQVAAVRSLAESETLLELATQSLGQGAFPFRATLFDKSAQSNWLVVWHQDTALPLKQRKEVAGWGPWSVKEGTTCAHATASALEEVLAIRVHLDDSNVENGVLKILPGTHKLGVLSDDAIHDLAAKTPAVECCVPAGGVLLIEYASRTCFDGDLELAIG